MAYGIITEQGDLGLGFEEVTEEEEKFIKESFETDSDNEEKNN